METEAKAVCEGCGGPDVVTDSDRHTHFCDCRAPKCPECGDALISHAGRGAYYHRSNYDLLKTISCSLGGRGLKADGSPAWEKASVSNVKTSMREIQTSLPWSIRYSQDFRTNPQPHKDFAHALVHISKAAGKLAALVDDMDHDRSVADDPQLRETYGKYVADLVICAMRMSNTFPGGVLDLEKAVLDRIKAKNPQALPSPALNDGPVRWELLPECPHCKAAAKQPCLPLGNICVERILPFVKDEATKIEGT